MNQLYLVVFQQRNIHLKCCLTSLLFRRVIFKILTENFRLNASTFDFLSSSSIDVNGKWSDSSWIIFAPILKFVGLILCTTIPPTLHLVVHTWLWGFVSVVSAIPFTAGKFIWMILLGIRCWQRMKGDQPQTVRGNNLQQRRVYNLLKKSLLYRSNQINLSIFDISTKVISKSNFVQTSMIAPDSRFSLETTRERGRSQWGWLLV